MERIASDLGAFESFAAEFALKLQPKGTEATLVTLSGELGAGKTAFVKAVAKTLGIAEDLTSPTFVLMKSYALPGATSAGFARLIHIDAYRLEKGSDLAPLRFDELLKRADNLIMLEWPEKVADALPEASARISIKTLPDGARQITYA